MITGHNIKFAFFLISISTLIPLILKSFERLLGSGNKGEGWSIGLILKKEERAVLENGLRDSECLERGAQKRGTDPKFWVSGCRN